MVTEKYGQGRSHLEYFQDQLTNDNAEFWARLGEPDLKGLRVLELGCGHGALTIDMARRGAATVHGLDLDASRIAFAAENLSVRHPEFVRRVRFEAVDLTAVREKFDVVVSKDTLEHVDNLADVMLQIRRVLTPGGCLLAGFGPLYYSPFGDHGRYWGTKGIPWLPALLPDRLLFKIARWRTGRDVRSSADVGLNKLTPTEFRRIIAAQGWKVASMQYNGGRRPLIKILRVLRKVPLLERYFTTSIYAILQAP